MSSVQYIIHCKASHEHFTFSSLSELMDYLKPLDGKPHFENEHDDLQIYKVAAEMVVRPQETVPVQLVKSWMLREKTT